MSRVTHTRGTTHLGRFGGLLKLWLSERPGQGARVADVEGLLRQTREFQRGMLELMTRV